MPKIAIINFIKDEDYGYDHYSACYNYLGIPEWKEVTEEELDILRKYYTPSVAGRSFAIVEQQTSIEVEETIKQCIEKAAYEKAEAELAKQRAEELKRSKALKKKAKDEAAEKKLLEELLKKHQPT
jgi:hypothetical protein